MISVFRRLFSTRRPQISVRSRVNLVGTFGLLERTDGVVESMMGDEASVEWANGARSVENTRRLVRISG
ncbi:MAG TPA: hypothetical protein VN664_08540 [Burkholderiales bacterium]|jgi:hypothetical protein|nr:hypothetical protein [Burkholderiales bacterium]